MKEVKNPKFIPTETSTVVEIMSDIRGPFEGDYGQYWVCDVDVNGKMLTWFINTESLKDEIKNSTAPGNKKIVVKKEAHVSKAGKPYTEIKVLGQAVLNNDGTVVKPKPTADSDPGYWEKEKHLMVQAIYTAMTSIDLAISLYTPPEKDENGQTLPDPVRDALTEQIKTAEAIQKIATTLYIQAKKA